MINAKYLRYLREDQNMTQFELAVKAGVTPVTVSDIERGKRTNPTINTIEGLAKALGVNSQELMKR